MTLKTPSRRTIVKGAAWTAPVVTMAATAPSLAASSSCETPHDLSTSIPGSGNRISDTQLDLSATNFINSGCETIEGLVIVFEVDSGQTIEDIQTFGQPIENLAVGSTIEGEGSNTVTLTLAPGTELGQVIIDPEGNYQSPAGQTLILGQAGTFNLSVTVNAGNMAAGDVPYTSTQEVP